MKATDFAINRVVSILEGVLQVPVMKYSKPTVVQLDEYVVVNSLPINADIMQRCVVNVNFHVKDVTPGAPDVDKIESGTSAVIAAIDGTVEKGTSNDVLIDYESQETHREDSLDEHYSNIRFTVRIINK